MLLSEEIILLSLKKKRNRVNTESFQYGIVTAILADLERLERIIVQNNNIYVSNQDLTGSDLLDIIFTRIIQEKTIKKVSDWMIYFAKEFSDLENYLIEGLIEKGHIKQEIGRKFFFFPKEKYSINLPNFLKSLKFSIKDVLIQNKEPNKEVENLISIINALGMISDLFNIKDRRKALRRAHFITANHVFGSILSKIKNNLYML